MGQRVGRHDVLSLVTISFLLLRAVSFDEGRERDSLDPLIPKCCVLLCGSVGKKINVSRAISGARRKERTARREKRARERQVLDTKLAHLVQLYPAPPADKPGHLRPITFDSSPQSSRRSRRKRGRGRSDDEVKGPRGRRRRRAKGIESKRAMDLSLKAKGKERTGSYVCRKKEESKE